MPDPRRNGSSTNTKDDQTRSDNPEASGIVVKELRSIDSKIPYKRSFIHLDASGLKETARQKGLMKGFRKNVKGLFETSKIKGIDKNDVIKLRKATGDLKEITKQGESSEAQSEAVDGDSLRQKSKKELLEEKRKSLKHQSKSEKKKDGSVGIRLEIEKLKKKFPTADLVTTF